MFWRRAKAFFSFFAQTRADDDGWRYVSARLVVRAKAVVSVEDIPFFVDIDGRLNAALGDVSLERRKDFGRQIGHELVGAGNDCGRGFRIGHLRELSPTELGFNAPKILLSCDTGGVSYDPPLRRQIASMKPESTRNQSMTRPSPLTTCAADGRTSPLAPTTRSVPFPS
jgi:hypothetical protein